AVRSPDVAQDAWRVANRSHRLVRREHAPDQPDRRTVLGQVPERTVTSRIKYCVIVGRGNVGELDGMGEQPLGNSVRVETTCGFGLGSRGFAPGIHRRLATERRGQSDLRARILKYIVWRCELLEPESGLFTRRTELVA